MRVNEILVEGKKLDEKAPVGLGSKLKAGIKSAFGSASGKAQKDVNTRATEIFKKFQDWALRGGVDMNAVPAKDIQGWFKTQNLVFPQDYKSAKFLNLNDKATSTKFWTGAASAAFKGGAQVGADLGSGYGLGGADAGSKAGKGSASQAGSGGSNMNTAYNRLRQAAQGAGGATASAPTDFKSLKTAVTQLKPSLKPNQINALVKLLTG